MSARDPEALSVRLTLLLVSTLTVMAGAAIAPALPLIEEHFADWRGADVLARLLLTLPALFIVLGGPLAGTLIDLRGRKATLTAAALLFAAAGSSGLYLPGLYSILAGRAVLGVAVAGVMTSVTALLADYYDGERRAALMGLQGSCMAFGGVFFLAASGALAELHWRAPFAIYLVSLALLPAIATRLYEPLRESAHDGGPRDASAGSGDDADDARVARFSLRPAASPGIWFYAGLYLQGFAGMAILFLIPVQAPFYLERTLGASPTASGLAIAASTLSGAAIALFYGRLRRRLHFASIAAGMYALMAIAYTLLAQATSYPQVILAMLINGLGFGLYLPNLNVWLSSRAPSAERGRALGGLTGAIFLGQFLSPILAEPVRRIADLSGVFQGAALLLLLAALGFGAAALRRGPGNVKS